MNQTYLRGDMYYADLGQGIGSEQEGYRPVSLSKTMSETSTVPPLSLLLSQAKRTQSRSCLPITTSTQRTV